MKFRLHETASPRAEASRTPHPGRHRMVADDQGELVDIVADSTPFGLWLRRAVVDDYGDEVMPNPTNPEIDPT